MRIYSKALGAASLLAMAVTVGGCGKKTLSDFATISTAPSQPIVITGKFTYDNHGQQTAIQGPWFKFKVNLNNGTGKELTVISMNLTIQGFDQYGNYITNTVTYDPSMWNYNTVSYICDYFDFGDYLKDTSAPLHVTGSSNLCDSVPAWFYVSGNPDPGTSNNFHYNVTGKIVGWFGPADEPEGRFERQFRFTTQ